MALSEGPGDLFLLHYGRRRYSSTLRQQAVEYWQHQRGHEGVRAIAAALGVSVTTLQRWTRGVAVSAGCDPSTDDGCGRCRSGGDYNSRRMGRASRG